MNKLALNVEISDSAKVGRNTKIWSNSKISDEVEIGENCVLGRSVYIGPNIKIGDNCKIQNNVLIFEPAAIGNGVFIGPGVIFTNDLNPRAVTETLQLKTTDDWEKVGVTVLDGASIGAGAVVVAPVTIGKWCMVGAGSIVTKDVGDFSMVVGNPAKHVGWVGISGFKLVSLSEDIFQCPVSKSNYRLLNGTLSQIK